MSLKSDCRSNSFSVHHLNTTEGEADTCMLLHAINTTERGAALLGIQSPDTDVLVLALWKNTSLCKERAKHQSIPLGLLYNAIGGHIVPALPGFHAFSGNDETGTICVKSKMSSWNALKKADEQVLEAFVKPCKLCTKLKIACLGCLSCTLYMCWLYLPVQIAIVKELCWFLFSKKQYAGEKLSPTKAAL